MSTPIRGPGDASRPGVIETAVEVPAPVREPAPDGVEPARPALRDEATGTGPRLSLLSPSASVVRERPLDAAVLERVFDVLERLFANPAFVSVLTALAALPRLSHVAAAISGSLALMSFLNEYLVRGRADPLLLAGAAASLGATLSPAGQAHALALVGGAALLARLKNLAPPPRRAPKKTRVALPSWRSDEELADLLSAVGASSALPGALLDDDAASALADGLDALRAHRDKLRRLKTPNERDARRLHDLDALFEQHLPAVSVLAATRLSYGTAPEVREAPAPGQLWRLDAPSTLDAMVQVVAADPSYAERNRFDIKLALAAYNGVRESEALKAGDVVYVPTADEVVPPPAGWPEVMPLPARTSAEARRRLVELAPLLTAGRADGLAGRAARLLHVLDRMPVRPQAYELPEAPLALLPEPTPQPA